ncbi:Amiloride-sensitive sodium channel [Fasciolopsis buskii]|uniref:Amiloride-sensitive sodium channel n=1 Tax=Fasciolopsis buskii TaxID=27845 RepID=A0A8E0S6S2_9TREM|nr:Amiloride-sensitive sodium channel [Fasciolopsis buski]
MHTTAAPNHARYSLKKTEEQPLNSKSPPVNDSSDGAKYTSHQQIDSGSFPNAPILPTLIPDEEQPKFLTGWVPVVKIFTTKNRAVRSLWAIFTVCMVIALVSSITVVVHRHLSYVTVIRLDERGPQDDLPPPAVTICLVEHELTNLNVKKLKQLGNHNWNIIHGATKHCDENNVVTWNSQTDARSRLYEHSAHMIVKMATDPVVCFTLNVLEQVPAPPNSICTTFETMPRFPKNASFWKVLRVHVSLAEDNRSMLGRPSVIVHDQNSIPLNKLARSINEFIVPGTGVSLFYNKELTKRLSTRNSQCDFRPVRIMDHEYKYDMVACQWRAVCQHYHANCQCLCPLEMLRRHLDDRLWHVPNGSTPSITPIQTNCPTRCHHNYPIALVNSTACPQACVAVTYKRINRFVDFSGHRGQFSLYLIQPEGLTEMIEEELYSLPKLFSEIGGLSSFCFGFSCILFFELFELAFWLRCTYRSQFANDLNEYLQRGIDLIEKPGPTTLGAQECVEKKVGFPRVDSATFDLLQLQNIEGARNKPTAKEQKLFNRRKPFFRSHPYNCRFSSPQSSHQIVLNPIRVCRVDGTRLSQYPSDKNSPILGLQQVQKPLFFPNDSTDRLNEGIESHIIHVTLQLNSELFTLPIELNEDVQ